MRALPALLLAGTLLLAGCLGASDSTTSTSGTASSSATHATTSGTTTHAATGTTSGAPGSTASGTGSSTSTPTGTGTQQPNRAPTFTYKAYHTKGAAPLNVTFTVNATDPDGDALTVALAYGDGASLNGTARLNVTHAYAAGNYTARIVVSDGKASVNATVAVNATATAGTGSFARTTLGGTTVAPCGGCPVTGIGTPVGNDPVQACASWLAGQSGGDCWFGALPAGAAGQPWTATSSGKGLPDVAVMFFDACKPTATLLDWTDSNIGDESGTVPAGATCVMLYDNSAATSSVSMTLG